MVCGGNSRIQSFKGQPLSAGPSVFWDVNCSAITSLDHFSGFRLRLRVPLRVVSVSVCEARVS